MVSNAAIRHIQLALGSVLSFAMLAGAAAAEAKARRGAAGSARSVGAIQFSAQRGFYNAPIEVAITTRTPGAQVYYTTNGAAPAPNSGLPYERPLRIETTTVLRAAAFKDGVASADVDTHSYIFPKDVLKQTGAGFPKTWGTNQGAPVPADYEMDP